MGKGIVDELTVDKSWLVDCVTAVEGLFLSGSVGLRETSRKTVRGEFIQAPGLS